MEGVGSSFCVYDNNFCIYSWNSKLSPYNTIYQAGAFVILNALNWHLNHHQTRSFIIVSNSQSVITALIKNWQNNKMLQDVIKSVLTFKGTCGVISWVKAHTGIVGNDRADELAKKATLLTFTGTSTQLPLTKSYVSSILFKYIMDAWQSRWDSLLNGRFPCEFLPKVSLTHLYDNYFLNLFLTNRGPFPSFLQYISEK